MGTRERKERELQAREQLFLDTARELIRSEGLLNLQMARLARACDYATGTLYQHFNAKEDLLVALATQGLQRHTTQFQRAATWKAGTRERMFALTVVDDHFVQKHPGLGRLTQYVFTEVVWENASEERRKALVNAIEPAIEAVGQVVADALDCGDLETNGLNRNELMLGPWALCHGMHSLLQVRGMLDHLKLAAPRRSLLHHAQVMLNGMQWQPIWNPTDQAALDALVDRILREVVVDETV